MSSSIRELFEQLVPDGIRSIEVNEPISELALMDFRGVLGNLMHKEAQAIAQPPLSEKIEVVETVYGDTLAESHRGLIVSLSSHDLILDRTEWVFRRTQEAAEWLAFGKETRIAFFAKDHEWADIVYYQNWPLTVVSIAPREFFDEDVVCKFKLSERGYPGIRNEVLAK